MKTFIKLTFILSAIVFFTACQSNEKKHWKESRTELELYKTELNAMRAEFREAHMPDVPFFLFGMGNREKLLYKEGKLIRSFSEETLYEWDVAEELIVPSIYRVILLTRSGESVIIEEDENAVWITEGNKPKKSLEGTQSRLNLPDFNEYEYPRILKVLHQEILINIVDGMPLPNYFVYNNGWRRDGAMMAMCLEKTGNVELIKSWVLSFTDPYDRNNAGEEEADNLGQTLYLLSLFADKDHPAVKKTMEEVKKYERNDGQGKYIIGRSDFHEAPVYQTKFLKWGLKKIGLQDEYIIPEVDDDYSSLFWWDYTDAYMPGTVDAYDKWKDDKYPYIGWAADHFHGLKRNAISNRDYPLTWEIEASQAKYEGMRIIHEQYVNERSSSPHTWHAAEVFLYLLDR